MNKLTFLMPCLNEAETLEDCIVKAKSFLKRKKISGEILIADNGSTDGSQDIARRNNARVITVSKKGYGSALKEGIHQSNSEFIIMGDSDNSYAFDEVENLYVSLKNGNDLVVGNRFKGTILKNAMPFLHRYLGNPVLSFLARLFFHSKVGDFHCGLRGFKRKKIISLSLKSDGMEFASEMIIRATQENLKISEVPINLYPDGRKRPPHLRTWRDGWRHLKFILMLSPRTFMYNFGLILLCLGSISSIFLYKESKEFLGLLLGTRTFIMTVLLAMCGFMISITADILDKLFLVNYLNKEKASKYNIFNLSTELIQIIGILLTLIGISIFTSVFASWYNVNFGPLKSEVETKNIVLSSAFITSGIFLIVFSFVSDLLSYLDKKRL